MASQSVMFEELLAMLCQNVINKFTCTCLGVVIMDENVQ